MSDDADLRWLAALGGHAGGDAADEREAAWLRAAYRAWDADAPQPAWSPDPATEAELLALGRAAGLRLPPPPRSRRGLLLGALALGAATLWWWGRPRTEPSPWTAEQLRGDPPLWLLRDADPLGRRERLAARLEAAGLAPRRYERLGRYGLELQLPAGTPAVLLEALWRDEGVRPDAEGWLRVEVEAG